MFDSYCFIFYIILLFIDCSLFIGYFVYVDGLHAGIEGMLDSGDPATAWMKFQTAVIPFVGDDSWVNDALLGAKETLQKPECPEHAEGCEIKRLLDGVAENA